MTVALDAALSGMRVAQQSLDVASTNISNASVAGYTRKILPTETLVVAGRAAGVDSTALIRHVDETLIGDLTRQTAIAENYNILQKYYNRIQDFHGASDVGRSLSSQLTSLANSFTNLSTAPNDDTLLANVVLNAQQMTGQINDFAALITDMRNGAETEIASAISDINITLDNIADLNLRIQKLTAAGQSAADLQDKRDIAIQNIAKYMDIATFMNGSEKIVITRQGQTLADHEGHHLFFSPSNANPLSFYPGGGLNGIRVDSATGIDITQSGMGGRLGALIDLRDDVLPKYTAQLDEFAQKLAERFDTEGLRLFADENGVIPPSVADPGITGYSGFSSLIQVNQAVIDDNTLIRSGTTGNTEAAGSNEVIRRVAQFAFGVYAYQEAEGTVDITNPGPPDLATQLGLSVTNAVAGNVNISSYAPDIGSYIAGLPLGFTIDIGGSAQAISVLPTDTAADLVTTINTAFGSSVAFLNGSGQLVISGVGDITISDGTIGAANMALLGFSFGVTVTPNPSFQVQVGTRPPVIIDLDPGDTSVELLAKLNAVTGLTATTDGSGHLILRPTDGGDLRIVDKLGGPLAAMGVTISSVAHTSFRQNNLGPDGSVSTGLLANASLQDFMSSVIAAQGEDARGNEVFQAQETSYLQTLEARNANFSGVNIDQEMSDLIRIQSAYAAAAKMITASREMFDQLLNAVR